MVEAPPTNYQEAKMAEIPRGPFPDLPNKDRPQNPDATTKEIVRKVMCEESFNAYCVDCTKSQSTHFILNYGIFVCEDCAKAHNAYFPCGKHYIKDALNEYWDPHQLKILGVSGNKVWYDLMKEYVLDKMPIQKRYDSSIARWLSKEVHWRAYCGLSKPYPESKPFNTEKNLEKAGTQMKAAGNEVKNFFKKLF